MRKIIFIFLIAVAGKFGYAQPPAGTAAAGNTYGEKITADNVVALSEMAKGLSKTDTIHTKITGKVLASCPKKGCWMWSWATKVKCL